MPSQTEHAASTSKLAAVFVALMLLLALTVFAATYPLGAVGLLIALAIAGTKAVLIILYFMQVRYAPPVTRVFVAAGFVWLSIMFVLTLLEYAAR